MCTILVFIDLITILSVKGTITNCIYFRLFNISTVLVQFKPYMR